MQTVHGMYCTIFIDFLILQIAKTEFRCWYSSFQVFMEIPYCLFNLGLFKFFLSSDLEACEALSTESVFEGEIKIQSLCENLHEEKKIM